MDKIFKIAIAVLFFISNTSNICLAGKDDYVVLDTRDFLVACGINARGIGHNVILTKEYANSAEGQNLISRFISCQQAYESGKPAEAPGKPEGILEALRRHSVGQTIWGAVKFLDGDRYITVTKSVNTYDYNDPKGGWGCIDYDGNVKIPLKYHLIIDGDTDLDAIVIMDQSGRKGVLKNDGSEALPMRYDAVLFRAGWIIVCEYHNNKDGCTIYDRYFNMKISGMKDIVDFSFLNEKTDERYPFFCITNPSGKIALFDKNLRQITDYKFDEWVNMAPYWSGIAIGEKDTHIDIRTMQVVSGPHSKNPDWQ